MIHTPKAINPASRPRTRRDVGPDVTRNQSHTQFPFGSPQSPSPGQTKSSSTERRNVAPVESNGTQQTLNIMCTYKRVLYTECNHPQFANKPFKKCDQQKAYEKKETSVACQEQKSTPVDSYRVYKKCPQCNDMSNKTSEKLQKAKNIISESKKTLAGGHERCRAIMEDAGIDMSGSEDEADVAKVQEEMEVLDGKAETEQDQATSAEEFLKKRAEDDSAKLYM